MRLTQNPMTPQNSGLFELDAAYQMASNALKLSGTVHISSSQLYCIEDT